MEEGEIKEITWIPSLANAISSGFSIAGIASGLIGVALIFLQSTFSYIFFALLILFTLLSWSIKIPLKKLYGVAYSDFNVAIAELNYKVETIKRKE